ncbi:NRAMP family divalent metal transporter [Nocardioides aequoreus]|uniref:NRAMP family divalent metal transporter n=1 Tax=Nocardioides aequoreus TaxID=397278 RepID=UPI0004C2D42D|nr:NRAMP family divalent metal transporter [Nocardioides aequoreus]
MTQSAPPSQESKALKVTGRSGFVGAMFLMATSAIGPGFLTQTATFTLQLGAAFAFAILVSVLVDIAVQLNVWRIIGVSGRRAQDLANTAIPGSGYVLSGLDVFGGLVFNIGNIAGCTLGLNALFGLDVRVGAAVSAAFAIVVFLVRRAGVAMDRIVIGLGVVMLLLTTYVALTSSPPAGDALRQSIAPETVSWLAIATLIGGTVGGYIVYAGAHRMVDNGVRGADQVGEITRASVLGIAITAVMRVVLFLAILGVVSAGADIDETNPVASAFTAALGDVGRIFFGTVMWIAAITSVIGCSYTSTSFIKVLGQWVTDWERWVVVGFIVASSAVFIVLGTQPVNLLVFAGAFNALILPFGLGVLLWVAWKRRDLLDGYVYPKWLLGLGVLAWLAAFGVVVPAMKGLAELMGWA